MSRKKGFTLIELIIAIGIASILLILAYNVLFVGLKGHSDTFMSFDHQAELRYAIETTNNAIRFASVGFIVTDEDFKPKEVNGNIEGLVKPWNYLGLGPDGKSIVHYKYSNTDNNQGYYQMDVLAEASDNISYGLRFTKPVDSQENKIIKYILEIKKDGESDFFTTQVEAINAIHVIDWSDAKRQPVAIAYRTEDTPEIHKKPVAAMSMVLDTSGSMNNALDGGTEGPSRISQLKDTLNDSNTGLFSILEENDVYINLIPFANNANMPHKNLSSYSESEIKKFYNINKDKDKQKLKSMVSSLRADGGTNTGDSLRRAYYQLKDFGTKDIGSVNSNQLIKKYVIVLVDGVTTFGSANINVSKVTYGGVWRGKFNSFFSGSSANIGDTYYTTSPTVTGNKLMEGIYAVDNNTVPRPVGDGANLDKTYGEEYVKLMGNLLAPEIDQAFVIGYSNKKEDGKYVELESLTDIARALRIAVKDTEANEQFKDNKFVFVATDKESLRKAFEDIGGYINEELWQVHGPKLNP